ncbi:WXG100 family type VII secretion target [Microbacterium halimionae]|uniref:ESAT-6-like protein n=1 Tax=Microbacterium halimionae TaxID=1526413 RepID=A0A7W3JLH9_9MICO|nr:WXG100 family type VII secretion target [Microbacterium halimionae]MBA8815028.1 WXG100 family type VII secretion target [Microbacterium halimionae]NII94181.1 WXG100 family type VII secretion target [Microbacterium halimionae]
MPDLNVSPEALTASAGELRRESQRIEAALRSLEQEAARLRGSWDGAARVAYDNAHREWSTTFEQMKSLLGSIATATEQISENYVETDRNSAKLFTHN